MLTWRPRRRWQVVTTAMDRKDREREAASVLLASLHPKMISQVPRCALKLRPWWNITPCFAWQIPFSSAADLTRDIQKGNPTLHLAYTHGRGAAAVIPHDQVLLGFAAGMILRGHKRSLQSRLRGRRPGGCRDGVQDQMVLGFTRLLASVEDLALDFPDAAHTLSLFLGRAVVDEALPPSFLAAVLTSLRYDSLGVAVVHATGTLACPKVHARG